jgi:hypothetical protein
MFSRKKALWLALFITLNFYPYTAPCTADNEPDEYDTYNVTPLSFESSLHFSQSSGTGTFTGSYAASVKVDFPPATGNIQDKLTLSLDYSPSVENGWTGRNWECDAGYIEKSTRLGAINPDNPFMLKFNGSMYELVSLKNGEYRTRHDSHLKITHPDNTTWHVHTTDGTRYDYTYQWGQRWFLTAITDTHGIGLCLSYDKPSADEVYLASISYPYATGMSPCCNVAFARESRSDTVPVYVHGQRIRYNARLKQITCAVDSKRQNAVIISYTTDGVSNRSLISAITKAGSNDTAYHQTLYR